MVTKNECTNYQKCEPENTNNSYARERGWTILFHCPHKLPFKLPSMAPYVNHAWPTLNMCKVSDRIGLLPGLVISNYECDHIGPLPGLVISNYDSDRIESLPRLVYLKLRARRRWLSSSQLSSCHP